MQHVGRGSDGILFFQWRASQAGAEKFHAGVLPHAGTQTRIWRESLELRRVLDAVVEVEGSVARNRTAILFDWHAWWACELDSHPSMDVTYLDRAHALHRSLTDAGVGVDFAHPEADLTDYDLVLVPTLYTVTDAAVERLREAVEAGATALVTYFSGIVDENDHVHLGGVPAVTRHGVGKGSAWYAATRLDRAGCDALVAQLIEASGVEPVASVQPGVEVTRRVCEDGRSWLFVVNHTDDEAEVAAHGVDLVSGTTVDTRLTVAGGRVAVIREA
jgi:beta-galactosidase